MNAKKCSAVIFSALALSLMHLCCAGEDYHAVAVSLPSYPEYPYPPLHHWKAVWHDGMSFQSRDLDPETEYLYVSVSRNRPAPFLFFPQTSKNGLSFFKPAGCVYPFSLEADWAEGVSAFILYSVLRGASDQGASQELCARFNWQRLSQTVSAAVFKKGVGHHDVWRLDLNRIVTTIASVSFRASDVRMLKTAEAESVLPVVGGKRLFYPYIPSGFVEVLDGKAVLYRSEGRIEQFLCIDQRENLYLLTEVLGEGGRQSDKIRLAITAVQR